MARGNRFDQRVQTKNVKTSGRSLYEAKPVVAFWTGAETATTQSVVALTATVTTGATTITTITKQPKAHFSDSKGARALVVSTGGLTTDVTACTIVVSGVDIAGASITDGLAVIENQTTDSNGTKAFASIDSIVIPAQDGAGATFSFGVLDVLGLPSKALHGVAGEMGTTHEGTAPTFTYSSTVLSLNTADPNTALSGGNVKVIYYER